jgi:hypothetical protein
MASPTNATSDAQFSPEGESHPRGTVPQESHQSMLPSARTPFTLTEFEEGPESFAGLPYLCSNCENGLSSVLRGEG